VPRLGGLPIRFGGNEKHQVSALTVRKKRAVASKTAEMLVKSESTDQGDLTGLISGKRSKGGCAGERLNERCRCRECQMKP